MAVQLCDKVPVRNAPAVGIFSGAASLSKVYCTLLVLEENIAIIVYCIKVLISSSQRVTVDHLVGFQKLVCY